MEKKIGLFLLIGILGIPVWMMIALAVFTRRLRIRNFKMLNLNKGVILISNHPSLIEPALLPCLLLINLIYKKLPISAPDKMNYYNQFWFKPFRLVCIPIARGEPKQELASLDLMKKQVEQGNILILFPEGGRTFKGEHLGREYLVSETGERIRRFPQGLRRLFLNIDCYILPIWCRDMDKISKNTFKFSVRSMLFRFWKNMEICFGELINSNELPADKKQIIPYLEKLLLQISKE